MKKIGFKIPIVLIIIGVVLGLIGYFGNKKENGYYKRAEKTTAVITNIRTTTGKQNSTRYIYYASYEAEGIKYNDVEIELRNSHEEGDRITVYYKPGDAINIKSKETKGKYPIAMYIFGVFFLFVGGLFTWSTIKYNKDHGFY